MWELDLASQQLTVLYDDATTAGSPLNAVDNITRHAPSGDLYVAEDGGNMEVCLITTADAQDTVAPFLRFVGHSASEVTGPAFSPDGTRLYVSSQRGTDGITGRTYEITGPFRNGSTPPPVTETLVAAGSTWRYLDNGSNQGTAWSGRTFVDTAWAQGARAARLRRPDGHHGELRPERVGQAHHHLLPPILRGHPRLHLDDPATAARRRRGRLRERHRGGPQQHAVGRRHVVHARQHRDRRRRRDRLHLDRGRARRSTPAPTSSRWRSTRAVAPAPTSASTCPSRAPATPVRSRLRRRRPPPPR